MNHKEQNRISLFLGVNEKNLKTLGKRKLILYFGKSCFEI